MTSPTTTHNSSNLGKYKVDININGGLSSPSADRRLGGMSSINEDSPDSSSIAGVVSGSGATSNFEI